MERETLTGVAEDVCLLASEVVIHFQSAFSSSHRLNGVEKAYLTADMSMFAGKLKDFLKLLVNECSLFSGV